MSSKKFCNTYRASDRVSQYLIRHVIYGEWGRNFFTFERFHRCVDAVFQGGGSTSAVKAMRARKIRHAPVLDTRGASFVHEIAAACRLAVVDVGLALGELVSTARDGKTTPAAMQGGTVTITNGRSRPAIVRGRS